MVRAADEAVSRSVAERVGHGAPFGDDELAALRGTLVVTGARDLSGLEGLRSLQELVLFGCEPAGLKPLAALRSLRSLRLLATEVTDLAPLAACRALEELEINFCPVEQMAPLRVLPSLRSLVALGVPWAKEGLETTVRALRSRPRPVQLMLSPESELAVCRELRGRGLQLTFGSLGPIPAELLVRPGIGRGALNPADALRPDDAVDYVETSLPAVREYLRRSPSGTSTDAFMRQTFMDRAAIDRGASRFTCHVSLGDGADVSAWASTAPLSAPERAAIVRFARRFPTLDYYREDAFWQSRLESAVSVHLPGWWKAIRSGAVASVAPWRRARVRFDGFDVATSPRAEYAHTIWYALQPTAVRDPYLRDLYVARCGAYPVADWPDEHRSTLLISLGGTDRRIFECNEEDLVDADSQAADPMQAIYVAFDSYASMLGHIVAVEVDGRVIEAAPAT